jgi:hypothetical protein
MTLTDDELARIRAFAERVAPLYALLDWRWVKDECGHEERDVPGSREIRHALIRLAEGLSRHYLGRFSSTSGLSVWLDEDDERLMMSFTLEE